MTTWCGLSRRMTCWCPIRVPTTPGNDGSRPWTRRRQQYHHVPVVQFMLWTLGLVRSVWRMPRYGRHSQAPRGVATRQMGFFDHFAT
jgi:hypothetical protein